MNQEENSNWLFEELETKAILADHEQAMIEAAFAGYSNMEAADVIRSIDAELQKLITENKYLRDKIQRLELEFLGHKHVKEI